MSGARLTPHQMRERLAGQTIAGLFADATKNFADLPALRTRTEAGWQTWTYAEYGDRAARVAATLRARGVGPGDRVSLLVRNRPEFHAVDIGTLLLRATPTSMYYSSSPEQLRYLIEKAESKVVVVDDAAGLARLRAAAPAGNWTTIVLDDEWDDVQAAEPLDIHELAAAVRPDDIATIIFTSGTTGPSKGALLTHAAVRAVTEGLSHTLGEGFTTKRLVSYMPMAHVAERGNTHYLPLRDGHDVTCVPAVTSLLEYLPAVRPQYLFGPPRIWEKVWSGLGPALAPIPAEQRREAAQPMLAAGGLDAVEIAVTAAAAMPRAVLDGLRSIGLRLADGYGMTECGTGAMDLHEPKVGTVGRAISGTTLRLAPDGEIELDGAGCFSGYLGDPERTAEAFAADGWLKTGDIGTLDADGYLTLVDRKKDLIITAGGKNISPANIEALLVRHPLIASAVVIGDARRYIAALLVPDPLVVDLAVVSSDEDFHAAMQAHVDEVNASLSQVEQVKRFAIVADVWMPDSDVLTPTMKVRRRAVDTRYAELIESLYV